MEGEITRCLSCKGKKVVCGLGNIEKECTNCLGVGYVKVAPKSEEKLTIQEEELTADDLKVDNVINKPIDKRSKAYRQKAGR